MKTYFETTGLVIHRQVELGPITYSDREWLGVRTRCIWLFGWKRVWRVR